jgi:hypothetical protein
LMSSSSNSLNSLLSDMYSSILRTRLEQLLEGVTMGRRVGGEGPASSEQELAGGQPSERTVTIYLPEPVTEIPRHIFTSLPGRTIAFFSFLY